ncbi:MAG: cell division protein FtsB [Gammaproteobacteria bacterium]|jgi:cell division protein FtsB|nr:cell division protein FtsB [Gammaproteobacteria bacterium]MBT6754957.1 cell division protein FtsB [Gammaproteobacteria bacterium]MBT7523974.1 cell division protein FtsB [Gammaproteobacteria bacterium]MBT7814911.1 cell division protein FtsB [Gammaproteobacteria bacterium]|tara:strand:+ start:690 stop:959 length:270 start_codon:yes stop_codon:yes gene_type:complete
MNKIILALSFFLIVLIYKFTLSDNSYFNYNVLKDQVKNIKEENMIFSEKIEVLEAEIRNLETGQVVIEEKARSELGLTKENETFYQILK